MEPANHRDEAVERAAAQWLARHDRRLSAAEQDEYLQWLREAPAHGRAIARLAEAWHRLDQLRQLPAAPDIGLDPRVRASARRRRWTAAGALAAAAAVALVALFAMPRRDARDEYAPPQGVVIHPGPQRLELEDGSLVTLNAGAQVDVHYSPLERRVHLVAGEAHFAVAKNPARPFVVAAGPYAVRAVGTAFVVTQGDAAVTVLVTEGRVRLDASTGEAGTAAALTQLDAHQHAVVQHSAGATPAVVVRELAPAEMEQALAWRGVRLEFADVPLRDAIAAFNRFNAQQLVIGSAETGAIVIGGVFRADNLDTFVRLLDVGFDVAAETRGRQIVLRQRR